MSIPFLKPSLYRLVDGADRRQKVQLIGGQCECGYIFFPMQHDGCERCGSVKLEARMLEGQGKLFASTQVLVHADKARPVPFAIGCVALRDGPVVRAILSEDLRARGSEVAAVLVEVVDREGKAALDLRFASVD